MFSPRTVSPPTTPIESSSTGGGARAVSEDGFTDLELVDDYNTTNMHPDHHHSLPSVEQVRTGMTSNASSWNTRRLLQFGVLIGIVVLLLLVIIPVSLSSSNQNKNTNNNNMPSRFAETITFLSEYVVDTSTLTTSGSPQFRAAEWMADTDAASLPLDDARFLQRFALVVLYYSTQGTATWKHSLKFLTNNHECDWNVKLNQGRSDQQDDNDSDEMSMGVVCNDNQVVQQIVIDNMGITGTLPVELALLTTMTRLVLPHNSIYGTLPQQLTKLTELTDLILNDNDFSQSLPSWIGDLENLQQLVLSNNGFYSSLPDELEQLEELTLLALEDNQLTGNLDALALLQQLQHLYLQGNQFTGTVDKHWMTTLVNLRTLDASNNLLDGGIPSQLLELSQLQVLDLHDNNLSGTIESVTQNVNSLQFLSLYNNRLTDNIPESLSHYPNLEHLDLSSNQFIGAIPSSLKLLTSLTYLFLSDNEYLDQGTIPEWIHDLTNLRELSMRNTERVGSIPTWLDELTELQLLDLSENVLTSTIPSSLGYSESLQFLLLNRNNLNGTVPRELSQLDMLELVMLDKNSLQGDIDEVFCDKKLEVLTSDCKLPEVVCTCCSKCCSDDNDSCNADYSIAQYDASLETGYTREGYDLNPEHFVPAE